MKNIDYFRTKTMLLSKDISSDDYIYTDDLLNLLKDDALKELIINKYNIDKNFKIEIDKIGFVYDRVAEYSKRFELIRLKAEEKDAKVILKNEEGNDKPIYYFQILNGNEEDNVYDFIEARAIYDSLNLFYNGKKLSQYVKSLQSNSKKILLDDLHESWSRYYKSNEYESKTKIFRILTQGDEYFLKSINSESFKEYGIAESFVMAILELDKYKKNYPNTDFIISSISISESKLDIIITQKKTIKIEEYGFLRSSLSIRNEDQGNTSFGVYSTYEFFSDENSNKKIFLFPKNKDDNKLKHSVTSNHTVTHQTFIKTFESINELFSLGNKMKDEFSFYRGNKNYDEWRFKIEQKLISNNSPFKGIKKLQELFSKENTGHIDNLAKLLRICAESDSIEMEYDLKFKLRYLISNVLLYNNSQY